MRYAKRSAQRSAPNRSSAQPAGVDCAGQNGQRCWAPCSAKSHAGPDAGPKQRCWTKAHASPHAQTCTTDVVSLGNLCVDIVLEVCATMPRSQGWQTGRAARCTGSMGTRAIAADHYMPSACHQHALLTCSACTASLPALYFQRWTRFCKSAGATWSTDSGRWPVGRSASARGA